MSNKKFNLSFDLKVMDSQAAEKLGKLNQTIRGINVSFARFHSQTAKRFQLTKFSKSMNEFKRGARKLSTNFGLDQFALHSKSAAGATIQGFDGMTSSVKTFISAVSGAGLAIGTFGLFSSKTVGSLSEDILRLNQTAKSLGISPKLLSQFQFAAGAKGVSSSTLDQALSHINKMAIDASIGKGGESAMLLSQLPGKNVSLFDQVGKRRSATDILPEIAEGLKTLPDGAVKTKLTSKLLGTTEISPLLQGGASGIKALLQEAQRLKLFDEKSLKSASQYTEGANKLSYALKDLRLAASTELFPGLTKSIEKLTEFVSNNQNRVRNYFTDLSKALPAEVESLAKWGNRLASVFEFISSKIGVVNLLFGTLSVSIGFKAVKSVWIFFQASQSLLKGLMALKGFSLLTLINPWVIGFTALAGVATSVYLNFDKISKWVSQWGRKIKDVFSGFSEPRLQPGAPNPMPPHQGSTLEDLIQKLVQPKSLAKDEKKTFSIDLSIKNLPPGIGVASITGDIPIRTDLGFITGGNGGLYA